jgi:hypothetical protein
MTLKELEAWHRVEAEGLLRSAQSEDRRSAYDVLGTNAKESRDRARWHGVNRRAMTVQAAEWTKLIDRFNPPGYRRCGWA